VNTYHIIAVNRPGEAIAAKDTRVLEVTGNPFAISSSAIRRRVASGLSIRHLVPPPVAAYIEERDLYRNTSEPK